VLALAAIVALIVGLVAISGDDGDSTDAAATSTTTIARERTTTSSTSTSSTVPVTVLPGSATTSTTAASVQGTPSKFGDDPTLDALYTRCGNADYAACDSLYRKAAKGTAYRQYGDTCGNRNTSAGLCTTIYANKSSTTVVTSGAPAHFGDDLFLDSLWNGCRDGDMGSCDQLYRESGSGTDYEEFGATCGHRNVPSGVCTELYG
jgi:hypothetical protein